MSYPASYAVVVERRLSNTAKFSVASTTAWYLFASAEDSPAVLGFLNAGWPGQLVVRAPQALEV